VVPPDAGFTDETRRAYQAGWYRLSGTLPTGSVRTGEIRFPDGATLAVPVLTAAEAYRALDLGDAPCVGCPTLTVTGAALGTVTVRTSRGAAQVPAWLFTVTGLTRPVARVAVVPSAVSALPGAEAGRPARANGLVGAQDLTAADGTALDYRLGVGACDSDLRPLVYETADVVVLGGSVQVPGGPCAGQLKLTPARVTLRTAVGDRVVLDALTGQPLPLQVEPETR